MSSVMLQFLNKAEKFLFFQVLSTFFVCLIDFFLWYWGFHFNLKGPLGFFAIVKQFVEFLQSLIQKFGLDLVKIDNSLKNFELNVGTSE